MTHPSRGEFHDRPVYYQPTGRPVSLDEFYDGRKSREVFAVPPLIIDLAAKEVPDGFDLQVTTREGLDGVPFQIDCDFVPGGELDMPGGLVKGKAGDVVFLKTGSATYHLGTDAISISPGSHSHRTWEMRGSELAPDLFRVLITLVTPVDHTLELRCGTWSDATGRILDSSSGS